MMKYREIFDYISDWTLAIEPFDVRVGEHFPSTLVDLYRLQTDPKKKLKIHVHIKKYKMSEVPKENVAEWLYKRFEEKEDLLEYFRKNGRFPGEQHEHKLEWGLISWILGGFLLATIGFLVFLWKYFPMVFVSIVIACIFTAILIYLYEVMHQYLKKPSKQKMRKE